MHTIEYINNKVPSHDQAFWVWRRRRAEGRMNNKIPHLCQWRVCINRMLLGGRLNALLGLPILKELRVKVDLNQDFINYDTSTGYEGKTWRIPSSTGFRSVRRPRRQQGELWPGDHWDLWNGAENWKDTFINLYLVPIPGSYGSWTTWILSSIWWGEYPRRRGNWRMTHHPAQWGRDCSCTKRNHW